MGDTLRPRTGGAANANKRDKWRTSGVKMVDKDWRRGQSQHGGQAPEARPEHIAASLFLPKREPHSQLFGDVWGTRQTSGGQVADTRRTRTMEARPKPTTQGGHKADKWQTQGGQGLEARPKPTTQGRHKANKWRTQGGQVADKDWRRGQSQQHKADTWRTHSGDAARAYRGQLFS